MSQNLSISIVPGLFMPELHYSQGDIGRTFTISLGDYTIPSGATVQVVATKPSGFGFTTACTVSDNVITCTTTEDMTDEWGRFPAEVKITSGSTILGTANFVMVGEKNPHPDGTTDGMQGSIVPELTLLVERIEAAAETATADATTASTAATNASASATAAAASETNAATSETNAAASETAAASSATSAASSASAAAASAASVDVHTNGNYPDMTVGTSEAVIGSVSSTDTAPYIFRATAGNGVRCSEKLVGGSIGWNQLQNGIGSTTTSSGVTFTKTNDKTLTLSGTATAGVSRRFNDSAPFSVVSGHKYLVTGKTSTSQNVYLKLYQNNWSSALSNTILLSGGIVTATTTSSTAYLVVQVSSGADTSGIAITPQIFDLTAMFGSTIADAIYSAESSTTGAGVDMVKALGLLDSYHAYNAGELMSVNVGSKVLTGFNQWDEEWEVGTINQNTGVAAADSSRIRSVNYIHVLPGTKYYMTSTTDGRLTLYDADKTYIGYIGGAFNSHGFTTPDNCYYVRISPSSSYGTTYKNDICINISDSAKNGTYEPYTAQTVTYDDITLRGVPKISDGSIYYDGDTYESDGTVTRRYGIVDLGTLSWNYDSTVPRFHSGDLQNVIKKASSSLEVTNALCPIYQTVAFNWIYAEGNDNGVTVSQGGSISVKNTAYTNAATFKTAMSGVYLVYELATPTTETASAYTNPQTCDPDGTEEFIDASVEAGTRDVSVPVGHETKYYTDLVGALDDIISATPTTNGTYTLKATVTSSGVTYSWV